MKVETAVERMIRGRQQITDLYSKARIFGMSGDSINTEFGEIKKKLKAPQWVNQYLNGYRDALSDQLYRHDLDFRFIMEGDIIVSTYKGSPIYYEKMGYKPSDLSDRPNGHYWTKTNRPFSTMPLTSTKEDDRVHAN